MGHNFLFNLIICLTNIKEEKNKILEALDKGENVEFPEELKEYFLYLKDAFYINGLTRFPAGENGLSIQVRISYISAYSSVSFNGNSTEETLKTYENF
ncbi:hypothetical protein [Acinetobacter proteolyticus]|uniref:Uncharacterized protein n=1 Tax=Acinetobacter proteolyticus TaxID=1776741 RepID=A0A2N0WEX0_9GAMM|nr:hypothetical protein [Acinetobacter proteolyticus]PKF33431.1 hypothetical protein CW311_11560 [Acinetobacter proteolyticus]